MSLSVSLCTPDDILSIERHPDQRMQMGLAAPASREDAEMLCGVGASGFWGEAWACSWHGELVACLGMRATFGGSHVITWAILANGIGPAHLAVTRFARARVLDCGYDRIEAVARSVDADVLIASFPDLDAQQMIEVAMLRPSREVRFAMLSGLKPAHVLRRYGAAAETHMLLERIGR